MSAVETQTTLPAQRTITRLNSAEKAALVAAVAGGMTQAEAAQQFNVHRNTVSRICNEVRDVQITANPMARDWKTGVRVKAQKAVTKGLECKRDPYRAANIGLEVLYGLGELVKSPTVAVDNTNIVVSWGSPQSASAEPLQVVDTRVIDET